MPWRFKWLKDAFKWPLNEFKYAFRRLFDTFKWYLSAVNRFPLNVFKHSKATLKFVERIYWTLTNQSGPHTSNGFIYKFDVFIHGHEAFLSQSNSLFESVRVPEIQSSHWILGTLTNSNLEYDDIKFPFNETLLKPHWKKNKNFEF